MKAYLNGIIAQFDQNSQTAYNKLVGRDSGYQVSLKFNAEVKNFDIKLKTDGSDSDAGNGDYALGSSVWYYLNGFDQKLALTAGTEFEVFVELRNGEGKRINYDVPATAVAGSGAVEKDEIRAAVRLGKLGQFKFTVAFKTAGAKTLTVKINAAEMANKGAINVVPTTPKEMTFLPSCVNGAKLKDATAGIAYILTFSVQDTYKNYANFANDKPDLFFSAGQVTIQPACERSSQGYYSCKLINTKSGVFAAKSNLLAAEWKLTYLKGEPSNSMSVANLVNSQANYEAGQTVNFNIIPKNAYGETYTSDELKAYLSKYAVYYKLQSTNDKIVLTQAISATGTLTCSFNVEKVGVYQLTPSQDGVSLNCDFCTAQVKSSAVSVQNIESYV